MKFLILAALVAVAAAASTYEPSYKPSTYSAPAYETYPAHPYSFAYDVKDDYSYVNLGHNENTDGKVTSGSYHVLLPDGRTQTVTYKVDGYSGYVADVKYDGYAKYPEYKPAAYPTKAYPTKAYAPEY